MKTRLDEFAIAERLRRQEAAFQRWKHLLLASGILQLTTFVAGIYYLKSLIADANDPMMFAVVLPFAIPMLLILKISGSLVVGICLRDWNGNQNRIILIRLIERLEPKK
ncbi:MAG: hypothetical protein RIQ79_1913 [Verrucomicrobiota bacterium]|jgi:hypothetical protein